MRQRSGSNIRGDVYNLVEQYFAWSTNFVEEYHVGQNPHAMVSGRIHVPVCDMVNLNVRVASETAFRLNFLRI